MADLPEFEVWNHLESGLQSARDEFRSVDPELRELVERLAEVIADARGLLILPTSRTPLLSAEGNLLNHPWIKHATDIRIAEEGISRANEALDRYQAMKPAVAARSLPQPVVRYLKEAAATYLFGFDAACIALCRATLAGSQGFPREQGRVHRAADQARTANRWHPTRKGSAGRHSGRGVQCG